ncbi:hypothetical protein ZWY2020_044560 [Hordeum vulgare]|nr:hypothetical protein ZWY2020_044560 [Hordeum vulgare]
MPRTAGSAPLGSSFVIASSSMSVVSSDAASGATVGAESTTIHPSFESQSGRADAGQANTLILISAVLSCCASSVSDSDSDSQNAASSVLFDDTHLLATACGFTSTTAEAKQVRQQLRRCAPPAGLPDKAAGQEVLPVS